MIIYELVNTADEDCNARYFFVNLRLAQIFQKANSGFSIFTRETLDDDCRERLKDRD